MHTHNGAEVSHADTEPQVIDLSSSSASFSVVKPVGDQTEAVPVDIPVPQAASQVVPGPVAITQAPISVIGADLAISGQDVHVISKGRIRVEGKIQGDVLGTEVVIGDVGTVEGVVSGDTVKVFGAILGTIRGAQVEIEAGARVEGDIHHRSLSVNSHAEIDGRVCRVRDTTEPEPKSRPREDQPAASATPASQPSQPPNARKGRLWR